MSAQMATAMRAYRNARYHEDREGFFNALNRWSNFLTIVLGSGAFAGGAAKVPLLAMIGGAAAAIIGAAQLVFDYGGRARTHGDLRKAFLNILAETTRSDADIDGLEERMIDLYRGEPEVFNAVNALAYNSAQLAYGRPSSTLIAVKKWQARLRHIRRFEPRDFPDTAPA